MTILNLVILIFLLLSVLVYAILPSKFSKTKLFLLIEETILCISSLVILLVTIYQRIRQ